LGGFGSSVVSLLARPLVPSIPKVPEKPRAPGTHVPWAELEAASGFDGAGGVNLKLPVHYKVLQP
jgi:hypothetical protein